MREINYKISINLSIMSKITDKIIIDKMVFVFI